MNQQEVTGMLMGGGRYRATRYMVEVSAPDGSVWEIVDTKDIRASLPWTQKLSAGPKSDGPWM
jgi:hypothetical protein